MKAHAALKAVVQLAREMATSSGSELLKLYGAMSALIDDLEREYKLRYPQDGYISEKLTWLRWYNRCLAGIDTMEGTPRHQMPGDVWTVTESLIDRYTEG